MKLSMFASKEQQIEGLKTVLKQISFASFLISLGKLYAADMLTKAHKERIIKMARDILGISYTEYINKYKRHVPHFPKDPLIK